MMKKVLVKWLDIVGYDQGWLSLDEAREYRPSLCQTYGWVLVENESYITVVSTLSIGTQGCEDTVDGLHVIPMGGVVSRTALAERES